MDIEMLSNYVSIIAGIIASITSIPFFIKAYRSYKEWAKNRPLKAKFLDWLKELKYSFPFIIGIMLTLFVVLLLILNVCQINRAPEITITAPADRSFVMREGFVEGYSDKELDVGQYLYIIVESGNNWWAQDGEVALNYSSRSKKYEFKVPVYIGQQEEAGTIFIIRTVLVDDAVHEYLQNWFRECVYFEDWAGVPVSELEKVGTIVKKDYITVNRY